MVKKGQAAMEYLMTYGWAILVIVIVLAALLYLGVFNIGSRVPEQCNLPVGIMCNSAKLVAADLTLTLKNGHGNKINVCAITCDDTKTAADIAAITAASCIVPLSGTYRGTIDVGEQATVTANGAGCTDVTGAVTAIGARYRGKLFVQYIEVGDAGNARVTQGDLQATVQA
ncbi:MAG: hypothetical protein Q7T16_03365 [Candidatus Burarchaeum sp.]|nr:hypothetical protein [Candidatus Burarchaeum sp.]MDO8339671.1 hypothetical protein [Candidatus Burarchaeum sp.]